MREFNRIISRRKNLSMDMIKLVKRTLSKMYKQLIVIVVTKEAYVSVIYCITKVFINNRIVSPLNLKCFVLIKSILKFSFYYKR